jgi:hypothetical protein
MKMKKKNGGYKLTKKFMQFLKLYHTQTIRLHRLCWFGHVQKIEENGIANDNFIWIWKQQDKEVEQEMDGNVKWGRKE